MAGYKIVYNGGSAEIVEKKSRFIANVFPLGSEEEAAGILEGIKKKYDRYRNKDENAKWFQFRQSNIFKFLPRCCMVHICRFI